MRGMPRFLAAFCLSVCACPAQLTPTQDGEIARARRLLQATLWTDKAWGAHLAISAHDDGLRDLLIDELRRAQPLRQAPVNTAEYAYVESLFDALIRIGARADSDVILPFERNWRPEVLILLARQGGDSAGNENALFSMMDEKPDWFEWVAIGDLLAQMHSQRFFRKTLEQIEIGHYLVAQDTPDEFLRTGMSSLAGLSTTRTNPKGFPPIGFYELEGLPFSHREETILAAGPRPVYYRRTEIPGGATVPWSLLKFRNPEDVRGAYSPVNLPHKGSNEDVERVFWRETKIQWKDAGEFSMDAEAALTGQANAIRSFIEDAHRRGLGDVSGMAIKITPVVEDHRRIARDPLPAVNPHEIILQ
jgi:hypothetical protein